MFWIRESQVVINHVSAEAVKEHPEGRTLEMMPCCLVALHCDKIRGDLVPWISGSQPATMFWASAARLPASCYTYSSIPPRAQHSALAIVYDTYGQLQETSVGI